LRKYLWFAFASFATLVAVAAAVGAAAAIFTVDVASGASMAQTCSLATTKNDFSIIVSGPTAWSACRSLQHSWNADSPSSFANGQFVAKSGRWKQFKADQVCAGRHGALAASVWDSGFGWVGEDVCKDLVRKGWRVHE